MSTAKQWKMDNTSVSPDDRLTPDKGFHKVALRWLIDEHTVSSKMGVLGFTVFPPGSQHDPHVHQKAEEYIITAKGRGATLIGRKWYDMKPGQVFFIPRNVVHSTKNDKKRGNLEIYFIYAGASSFEKTGYRLAKA